MRTIVTRHILQTRGNNWNHMWNVGVRMLFLLSLLSLMSLYLRSE